MKRITLIIIFFLMTGGSLYSGVTLKPRAVFIDPRTKSGVAELTNSTSKPVEVFLDFEFIYENYIDSLGKVTLIKDDSVAAKKYSLSPYLRVFPRKIIIPPKSEQLIRFIVLNDSKLEPGTYWTRLKITSKGKEKEIDTTEKAGSLNSKFNLYTSLTFPVIYQKGEVNTGIKFGEFKEYETDSSYNIVIHLERTGNSPFWGSITARMFALGDDEKRVEIRDDVACPVYFSQTRTLKLQKDWYKKFAKKYRIEVTVSNSDMIDIPEDRQYNKVNETADYILNIPE